jgi:hypothetical protein
MIAWRQGFSSAVFSSDGRAQQAKWEAKKKKKKPFFIEALGRLLLKQNISRSTQHQSFPSSASSGFIFLVCNFSKFEYEP